MITLRSATGVMPLYSTKLAAGCDVFCNEDYELKPGVVTLIDTGLQIDEIDWTQVPSGMIPYIQVLGRSGLAKESVLLAGSAGIVDADYRGSIGILLVYNKLVSTDNYKPFELKKGTRVGQLVVSFAGRISNAEIRQTVRSGGWGSTGV